VPATDAKRETGAPKAYTTSTSTAQGDDMRDTVTPEALHLPATRMIDITDTFTLVEAANANDGSDSANRPLERRYARQVQTPPMIRAAKQ
jgi:hypothetical protein